MTKLEMLNAHIKEIRKDKTHNALKVMVKNGDFRSALLYVAGCLNYIEEDNIDLFPLQNILEILK